MKLFISLFRLVKVLPHTKHFAWLPLTIVLSFCNFTDTKQNDNPGKDTSVTIITWNLQNLFDGNDNDTKYEEYLGKSGWTQEKYLGRVNAIKAAIGKINPKPDIMIFQEIESISIVNEIADCLSTDTWTHFAKNPEAALGVSVISRYPFKETRTHSITVNNDTTPRPVLEVKVDDGEDGFVIFACHWKSKLGDSDLSENIRKSSARVILRRIREIWRDEPELGIIITGDLNENHDEFYRLNATMVCALIPDDPYCALLTGMDLPDTADNQKDFIVLSRDKPPRSVHFPKETIVLFSPWTKELENGTYYYKHNWETIDHFLLSKQFFNNTGWDYEKAQVLNIQPFISASGLPVQYNIKTGAGLSDHLPLMINLRRKEE